MLPDPGPDLDREVMKRLGERESGPVPYSTDARACERLVARLARSDVLTAFERVGSTCYCTLSCAVGKKRERLATGAGPNQPLALCRAVLNLTAERLRLDSEKAPSAPA